jgi:hypothetical protein
MAEKHINFIPGETVPLNAGTTSSSVAFVLPGSWSSRDVMVTNAGSNVAFVSFYSATVTATATLPVAAAVSTAATDNCIPVLGGKTIILCKNKQTPDCTQCAAITATGTSQLYFTAGLGN